MKSEEAKVIKVIKCWYCNGTGLMQQYLSSSSDRLVDRNCVHCDGRGTIAE